MIRQPGYMPNVGFFKKIQSSDIFVFLDDVQFSKDSFDNRNRIKTSLGVVWITVPLTRPVFERKINEVLISYETNWQNNHCNKIYENYKSAPYFSSYWSDIEKILTHKYEKLIDLNNLEITDLLSVRGCSFIIKNQIYILYFNITIFR